MEFDKINRLFRNLNFGVFLSFGCFVFLVLNPIFYLILFSLTGVFSSFSFFELFGYSSDLILFFLFVSSLDLEIWSAKEILHYIDVRDIFLVLFVIFGISFVFVLKSFRSISLKDFRLVSKVLRIILFLPIFLIPVFSWFWNEVFHNLLFSNDYWLMNSSEISFWLFSEWFFVLFYVFYLIFVWIVLYLFEKSLNLKNNF